MTSLKLIKTANALIIFCLAACSSSDDPVGDQGASAADSAVCADGSALCCGNGKCEADRSEWSKNCAEDCASYECLGHALTDNGDGTVTDESTGFVWQKGETRVEDWDHALSYCSELELAGSSSWELPTIDELFSLVLCAPVDGCYLDAAFDEPCGQYFAATRLQSLGESWVYSIKFYFGIDSATNMYPEEDHTVRVRCLRR